jgi:hypothetical protein
MKHDEARLRPHPDTVKDFAQRDALPFGDAAPAFDAIVPRNLRSRRKIAQICKRKFSLPMDEAVNLQPV